MSQQGDGLSAYWDEQRLMMSKRPRGRAELRETEPEAAALAGEGERLSLEELRAKAERVGAWLMLTDISHDRWPEGLAAYVKLQEEMQALEDGPWHSLRRPGDEYRGVVTFPADYPGPLPEGTWERLPDGRIEARLSLFQLRAMKEMRAALQRPAGLIEEQADQAPLLEPVIWLTEQQAHMLRPGWITLLQDVLPETGQPCEALLLSILDTRKLGRVEQKLCLWQRLDTGKQFRQIVEM